MQQSDPGKLTTWSQNTVYNKLMLSDRLLYFSSLIARNSYIACWKCTVATYHCRICFDYSFRSLPPHGRQYGPNMESDTVTMQDLILNALITNKVAQLLKSKCIPSSYYKYIYQFPFLESSHAVPQQKQYLKEWPKDTLPIIAIWTNHWAPHCSLQLQYLPDPHERPTLQELQRCLCWQY